MENFFLKKGFSIPYREETMPLLPGRSCRSVLPQLLRESELKLVKISELANLSME